MRLYSTMPPGEPGAKGRSSASSWQTSGTRLSSHFLKEFQKQERIRHGWPSHTAEVPSDGLRDYTALSTVAATWQNQQNEWVPSEDSDPPSLIRVFAVCMKKAWVLRYPLSTQRRHWLDWADAQADLNLRWVHSHFVGFVMSHFYGKYCAIKTIWGWKCPSSVVKERIF